MSSISKIDIKQPVDNTIVIEPYDIDALRLVNSTDREPMDVGSETVPVYFKDGIPQVCSGGTGGGGTAVSITPLYQGGTKIASYKIDNNNLKYLYAPSGQPAYKRKTIWPESNSQPLSEIDTTITFTNDISQYDFVLIHYAPSNNVTEERVIWLDKNTIISAISHQQAFFSCHYLSDVFIRGKFISNTELTIVESRSIPLPNDNTLKCVITKVEGLSFGVSGDDIEQGLTVRYLLWNGTLSDINQERGLRDSYKNYSYLYVHYYASNNPYEEKIIVIDTESLEAGAEQTPSQAYFTCAIDDDLYIKGQILDDRLFKTTERHTSEDAQHNPIYCVIDKIEGICLGGVSTAEISLVVANPPETGSTDLTKLKVDGTVYNISSGGGGTDPQAMHKGVDYVTAGFANDSGVTMGSYSTAEGSNNTINSSNSHIEGANSSALYGTIDHVEGSRNIIKGKNFQRMTMGNHAEGVNTSIFNADMTIDVPLACHVEGYGSYVNGEASHGEGRDTVVDGISSHAEGGSTTAKGHNAHVEGSTAYAYSYGSGAAHAEGNATTAMSIIDGGCHAEGYKTYATNKMSGGGTRNTDGASHAEGIETIAYDSSHAEGYMTMTTNFASHAQGQLNVDTTTGGMKGAPQGTAFVIGNGYMEVDPETYIETYYRRNAFVVDFDGNMSYGTSSHSPNGDYAEYFEWMDGNLNNEDRVGYFVTFDKNNKIRIANKNDNYILGIISGCPTVIGNSDCSIWNGAILKDNFGRILYKQIPIYKVNEETGNKELLLDENGEQVFSNIPMTNKEYDVSQLYIPRRDRKEWDAVGMLGVLYVRDDGTCQEDKYCSVTDGGIATFEENYNNNCYRVLERVDNNIIKILFR